MLKMFIPLIPALLVSSMACGETVGLSKPALVDRFQDTIWKRLETGLVKNGEKLETVATDKNPTQQAAQVAGLYAGNVDIVLVMSVSTKGAMAVADHARQAHKPLVFVNTAPPAEVLGNGIVYVGSDEKESGTLEMTEVCRRMKGKGTIAILMGDLSDVAARTRTADVHQVLQSPACSGIELLEEQSAAWSRPQAQEVVRTWLQAGVKPDAIVSNNDEMALGAIMALKEGGVKNTIVAGVDATSDALQAMQAGDLSVTVLQDGQQQADKSIETAKTMLAGGAVPSVINVPFRLVTPDMAGPMLAERAHD